MDSLTRADFTSLHFGTHRSPLNLALYAKVEMFALIIILYLVILILSGLASDALLEYQYKKYKDDWILDGKPSGFIYRPKGSSTFSAIKMSFTNYANVPYWAGKDERAIKLHKKACRWIKTFKYATLIYVLSIIFYVFWV